MGITCGGPFWRTCTAARGTQPRREGIVTRRRPPRPPPRGGHCCKGGWLNRGIESYRLLARAFLGFFVAPPSGVATRVPPWSTHLLIAFSVRVPPGPTKT